MELNILLANLKQACLGPNVSTEEIKNSIDKVLEWLNEPEHNTDENCREISMFTIAQLDGERINSLPLDIQDILFDMGAALFDAHTAPQIADNFKSKPEQLLTRVRKMHL